MDPLSSGLIIRAFAQGARRLEGLPTAPLLKTEDQDRMFNSSSPTRSWVARLFVFLSFALLAACQPVLVDPNANSGQRIDTSRPVQVALLVPGGSGEGSEQLLASNLENAARLAMADLNGVDVDLRVYNTAGNPEQAATVARAAVDEGAKIILGPLFAESANAVGVAVAGDNVNVLTFSNNPTIAGSNVFVLGSTFQNSANRLVNYASRNGLSRFGIVNGDDVPGASGRDAIANAVRANGAQVAGVASYPLSQQGIFSNISQITSTLRNGAADAVFMTGGVTADLPIIATALDDNGFGPDRVQYIGLTRWDSVPQALELTSLQGGLFAVPDRARAASFESRYFSTYDATPHPLAGLAYDGIAAIGALVATGEADALTRNGLTTPQGFTGTNGVFRFLPNGLNERGLAVATIQNNQVLILESAPRSFGVSGS